MNHLLIASILTTGLALGGASGVYAADQYGNSDVSDQQSENYRQDSTPDKYSAESGQYTVKAGDTLATIAEAAARVPGQVAGNSECQQHREPGPDFRGTDADDTRRTGREQPGAA